MSEIHTYDKPSLVAAFTAAILSDSDTLIRHERESGISEWFIKGDRLARLDAISPEVITGEGIVRHNAWALTGKKADRAIKRVLRNRKRAINKMKRAAVKVLCG